VASQRTPKIDRLSPVWTEYELVDTGAGRKLERFGPVTLVRPEAQAKWSASVPKKMWDAAQGEFVQASRARKGQWRFARGVPTRWEIRRGNLAFWVEPTPAGHVGVFPDQASHWDWAGSLIESAATPPKILSLFGYTGLATLACAAAGAQVAHVDASQKAVQWARKNQALSKLDERPIRWLVDDAQTFVARELRRGRTYDGLLLDPPRFGRGPKGELWKVEEALPALLRECRKLLSPQPLFVLLNTYTTVLMRGQTNAEAAQLQSFLQELLRGLPARIGAGELVLKDRAGRQIPCSVFARATFATVSAS
jgi:23S rRNA (cytosine1962-C5)-methyltransferase